jgi:hypothetical protein
VPNRAKLTTRGISTSTVSTDTLPKNAALSNNELDSNFLNLRDQSFSIVGDDSTGIDIRAGDTIKFAGAGGATITAVGDTITITTGGGSSIGDLSVIGSTVSSPSNANLILTTSGTGAVEIYDANFIISDPGVGNEGQGEIARIGVTQVDFNHNGNQTSKFSIYGGNGQTSGAVIPFQVDMLEQAVVRINNMLFPATTGSNGQVLTTNGLYELSWQNPIGNLTITNYTISSSSNESISILPNGTGNIILDNHTWPNTDGSNGQVLTTNGAGVLSWTTVSGGSGSTGDLVITGTTISAGTTNADITLSSTGTGNLNVDMDTLRIGDSNTDATITTNGTGDLILSTNNTLANSPSITIGDTTAGNIQIKPALGASVNTTYDQGRIRIGINDWDGVVFAKGAGAVRNRYLNAGSFSHTGLRTYDLPTATARHLGATFGLGTTLAGASNLGNTNSSFRALQAESHLDLAGISATYAGLDSSVANYSGQAVGFSGQAFVKNLTATTATNPEATGITSFNQIGDSTNDLGNITVTNSVNYTGYTSVQAATGLTTTVTNAMGFVHTGTRATGAGTKTITNEYAFRVLNNSQATNKYAFYADNDTYLSRIGTLERYLEKINALTSSSTITVDCDLAPVHTVTLGINTDFFLTNLSTGQSITIIITQDGTGSRTATFSTATSGAVKFAGGSKTLSTAASSIDVVTVFNDGTNYIGTLSKAFA